MSVRTAPKPPLTKEVFFFILLPFFILSYVVWLPFRDPVLVTVFGLVLDITGAVFLVVPDLKPVLSIFFNGKLKEARITLSKEEYGYSGMSDPMATDQFSKIYDSKGFRELVQVLSEVYDDKALKGEKRWADFHSMMPVEREAENRGGKERVFVFFDAESDRIFDADPEVVNSAVREKIETLDGRFRRNGILLLIIGFGYQILAQIV